MLELLRYKSCWKSIILSIVLCVLSSYLYAQEGDLYDLQEPLIIDNVDSKLYTPTPNRLTYSFSTIDMDNITISWSNNYTKKTKTKWFVRLQYRLSEDSEWIDVNDSKGRNVEFVTTRKRYTRHFSITLPNECNNQQFVQVSWLIDTYTKNKSNYPNILFKNLRIRSEYDKYHGLPAIVKVYNSTDDTKSKVNDLHFNKIPLHKVFSENKRLTIESKNIRDSITIRVIGENAAYFCTSLTSIDSDQPLKTLSVVYSPKKEGRHKATLVITTTKLSTPINIQLEGVAAKNTAYNENLLPKNTISSNRCSYNIPVFSASDYQYRIYQNDKDFQKIAIRYSWYRNEKLLFSMYDTVKKLEYCASINSPESATNLEIELSAKKKIKLKDYYFGSPKVKTMVKSGSWSDINNWQPKALPNTEDFVVIDNGVVAKVNNDVACNMLILKDSANVDIHTGKIFYVSNDISYGKNAFFTVHQHLLPSKWNYISSPINQAHATIFSMKNLTSGNDTWIMKYNTGKLSKMDDYWSEYIVDPTFILQPGIGYAVYTHAAMDVKYEGLLCSSSVTIPLVSTPNDRWNLIGNPYTAPLSSKKIYNDIEGKIQGNAILLLDKQAQVYNPIIIDNNEQVMIPSLESFFVEALEKPTEITFKREHQYIPRTAKQSWTNNNYLNLSVSCDNNWQYVLIGMDDNSSYGFDMMDCHKMFGNNENMPEIYLKDDNNEEYSVCVFPDYPGIYDIGLYIGSQKNVTINLNNLSIMPDYVHILIEDKKNNIFYNACESNLELSLANGTTQDFRIHILKAVQNQTISKDNDIFLWSDKGRILFLNTSKKVKQILIKKGNEVITQEDIRDNEVFSTITLAKGNYEVQLLIGGKWSEKINLKISANN